MRESIRGQLTNGRLFLSCIGLIGLWLTIGNRSLLPSVIHRNIGFLYYNEVTSTGNLDTAQATQAIHSLLSAVEHSPDRQSIQRALGYLYLATNDETAAFSAWGSDSTLVISEELVAKGLTAEGAGHDDQALKWYQYAIRVAPQSSGTWLSLGLLYEKQANEQAAMSTYTAGLEVEGTASATNGDLRYRLARVQSQQVDWQEWTTTLALVSEAIETDEFIHDWSRLQSHFLRGEALIQLEQLAEAKSEFEWVLERRPDDYFALLRLGQLHWEMDRDAEKAKQYFMAAAEIDPTTKWAYYRLAQLYVELDQIELADTYYTRVIELDPADKAATEWRRRQE